MAEQSDNTPTLKTIERNTRGELVAHLAGRDEPVINVSVVRCFPWSVLDGYVSVRDADGKEVVLLTDLAGLDGASRELIEAELHDRFFVPKIRRVTHYKAEFDVVSIAAETDRGEVTFQIRSRDEVRQLSATRAIFRDVDGNLYEVDDYLALDRASQRHLEPYF